MILAAPFLLLGLVVLPLLWWLLRALPPAPRVQRFPAIRLLRDLPVRLRESRRAPPWLLALRIAATLALVFGLAQPVLLRGAPLSTEHGTLLLAIDDGWSAAQGWDARIRAADQLLDRAARAGRPVRLLLTAPDATGVAPRPTPAIAAATLRDRLDGARPMPWPVDRAAAAAALDADASAATGSVTYLSDGLATAADAAFAAALRRAGPVTELRDGPDGLAVLTAPDSQPGRLLVHVAMLPQPVPRRLHLRGETAEGGTLTRLDIAVPAGRSVADAAITLPAELRNQIARLVLEGVAGPGAVRLLDEGDRRRPVGLLVSNGSDTPLLGTLFYLRRALAPTAELREGPLATLLSRQLSVLVAPDGTLEDPAERARVATWVRQGGTLIRFAGQHLAAAQQDAAATTDAAAPGNTDEDDAPDAAPGQAGKRPADPDPLLPVGLLGGARQLGGAMSWGQPEHPAPFPAGSPFAGLRVPADVTVSRQVLAQPAADLDAHSWARLADGTPLVTHAPLGDGQLVLFHVTSTAEWSNLPLSGLFPSMLQRLVQRAAGVTNTGPGDRTPLSPSLTLAGDGLLGPPPPSARALAADAFGRTPASAVHPAGLYGPSASQRALNLADALPPLAVEAPVGLLLTLDNHAPDQPIGPLLLGLALTLLAADMLATMWLRGLLPRRALRRGAAITLLLGAACLAVQPALAVETGTTQTAAALETRLAYVVTGDAAVDAISREGLEGLTAYANARTSAQLGHPDGVVPGHDDLAFYPLLYWPVTPTTAASAPDAGWTAALNRYMSHGGILMIDTQGSDVSRGNPAGGDADQGFSFTVPGTAAALRRATEGLDVPALRPVDAQHVLSHSFYLLHGYPGRTVGAPVWVARDDDLGNDGVSPVIIGANDWAAAWAVDGTGQTPYATIPGGETQRVTAYRFGVNAVMYALTGNYKTDQVHVPALLQRLGE